MSSSRLPGKVLKDLPYGSGVPVLRRIVERVRQARSLDEVVVATSDRSDDDPVAEAAERIGVHCHRGPLDDVLARYLGAIEAYRLDRVVRITGDCPCVDAAIIDGAVSLHETSAAEFTSNVLPRSYPKGLDVEVADASTLRAIGAEASVPADREHVFTYAYVSAPGRFRMSNLKAPAELADPDLRLTLDTAADYAFIAGLYDILGPDFDTVAVMRLVRRHPWLLLVNAQSE